MSGRDDKILELIDQVTVLAETKASNTGMRFYRWWDSHTWRCEVGEPGEFRGEGATLEAALRDLMKKLNLNKRYWG